MRSKIAVRAWHVMVLMLLMSLTLPTMDTGVLSLVRGSFTALSLAVCGAAIASGCGGDGTNSTSGSGGASGTTASGGAGLGPSGITTTGGAELATGGVGASTGGVGPASGGTAPGTGGAVLGSGGAQQSSGGVGLASGGAAQPSGGAQSATGGATIVSTGGSSGGSDSNLGGSPAGSTGGGPGLGGAATGEGSCVAGIATGDPCEPAVDTAVCQLLRQDCACDASGAWTCTPNSEETGGSSGSGGSTGSGGTSSVGSGGADTGGAGGADTGGRGSANTGGADTQPGYDYGATVESTSADCEVPTLPDGTTLSPIQKLPDPFKKISGERITKKSEWRCRREEIIKQAQAYIYGEKPSPPASVSGTVTSTQITVQVEDNDKSISFTAKVSLPQGQGPFPAVINVGSFGTLDTQLKQQGVAVIQYNNTEVGVEPPDESGQRGQPNTGKFYDIYGGTHSAGLLMAWAWGASRIMDVLQQSGGDIIDYRRVGVTGCSRSGKGAFAIGIFDERIALTIPQESSTAGVPAYRIVDGMAERTDYNYNGQNWLSNNFAPFVFSGGSKTPKLPIDTHSLIASMAPRGLLILENPNAPNDGMGARAGHAAAVAGVEVYKALGVEGNLTYISNHPQAISHCQYSSAYDEPLSQSIEKYLKHAGDEPGTISAGTTFNPSDWIDWETPTLESDTTTYGE